MPIQSKQQPPYYEGTTPIKNYKVLISQSSTNAPTVIELNNTLGNIIWSYDDVGRYTGTLTGQLKAEKTFFILTLNDPSFTIAVGSNEDDNSIYLQSKDAATQTYTNGLLYNTSLQITTYP